MIKMEQPNQNEPTQEERDLQTNIGARLIAAREGQRNPIHARDFLIQTHFINRQPN